jgi:hypothetical protein
MVDHDDLSGAYGSRQRQLPDDCGALSLLLPRITALTVAWFVALALMRQSSVNKTWDKAMFAGSISLAVLLSISFLARSPRKVVGTSTTVFSVCATLGLLIGIGRVERPDLTTNFWEGFGASVAIVAVVVALYLWTELDRIQASRPLHMLLNVAISVLVACDLLSLLRTLPFMVSATNNLYMLNDMLAPAAGRVPYGNYVPGYIGLYGWILAPFHHFLAPYHLAELATILLSALGMLSVLLAVTVAYRSMSSPAFWVAAGLVVPLTCVTVLHFAAPQSSVGSYFQNLPYRMFPAMLLSLIGIEELARLRRGIVRTWHLLALGALAGLLLWNTLDFGFAVVVAYTLVLAVSLPPMDRWRLLASWCGGLVGGFALYPLLSLLTHHPVRLAYFGLFIRAFAGGYDHELIQVPGPVLVVLPILLSSAAVGWCLLWRQRRPTGSAPAVFDRTVLTLALVGTWGMFGFADYLNQSYANNQLQILLMPCGVCLVALVSLAAQERKQLLRIPSPDTPRSFNVSLGLFPVALMIAMGFASILQTPNPAQVIRDLHDPYAINEADSVTFDSQLISLGQVREAQSYAKLRHGSLGYIGSSGNYVQLWTGLQNLNLYDNVFQFELSSTIRSDGCNYLRAHSTTFLLVPSAEVAYASELSKPGISPYLCGLYQPVDASDSGFLFMRKGATEGGTAPAP